MSTLYKNILVPLDGSELAAQALPYAEEIANNAQAKLSLLQVVDDPVDIYVAPETTLLSRTGMGVVHNAMDTNFHRQALDSAKWNMDELAASLRHRKINAEGDIDTGEAATCIVEYAEANDIDLIVMSTHGRTGLGRWTYGSVANKVLQAAPCPVLIVRPTGSKSH